jgi:tetratricopeptide (TPR) repeat protein
MDTLLPFKSLLLAIVRMVKGRFLNEVAAESRVSLKRLGGIERGMVKNVSAEEAGKVLRTLACAPAEAVIVSACVAGLAELDPYADPGDAADVEESVALAGWRLRERLRTPGWADAAHERYPAPQEMAAHRAEARETWERLRTVSTFRELALAARLVRELHRWSVVELLCEESERAAAKDAGRARELAVIAVRIARHLPVPEWWRLCLLAYAVAHLGNALRVASKLDAAGRTFAAARRLWAKGMDPDRLLDPGRLPDLESSLRRAQRRFGESLQLLEDAAAVTRRPEHMELKAASILAVMGEYNRAIEVLTEVAPRVERHPDRRLLTIQRFNLAVAFSHVGRHRDAARLLPSIRRMAEADELDRVRSRWLAGRISAGLGRNGRALAALDSARRSFARLGLHYDAALALLEMAAILLGLGRLAEVRVLAADLAPIFEQQGVHDEALNALRLFEEAVARQAATARLARGLLAWLFRAQHDKGLVFDLAACS